MPGAAATPGVPAPSSPHSFLAAAFLAEAISECLLTYLKHWYTNRRSEQDKFRTAGIGYGIRNPSEAVGGCLTPHLVGLFLGQVSCSICVRSVQRLVYLNIWTTEGK